MTTFVFANFFQTTIAAAATSTQTTISVAGDAGVPAIAAGQQWAIVVQSANTPSIREVMYVTATSGTTFTVARGQEGTAAQAWSIGDNVIGGNTSGQMAEMVQSPHMTDGSISPTFGEIHGTGIDGVPIGVATPSTGAFTALTALGPLSPNGFANTQVFTSSGTFTVPAGVTAIEVICVGGGAGGAEAPPANSDWGSGGGGGGGAAWGVYSTTPGTQYPCTIGSGGAGGTAGNGGAGGTTSFGSLLSATGGSPGIANNSAQQTAAGGSGSGGLINIPGGFGAVATCVLGSFSKGGNGGAGAFGLGAGGTGSVGAAVGGAGYGAGGAAGGGFASALGMAGTGGIIIVRW